MQESIVFLVRVQCRRKESSRSLSHLLMSFLFLLVINSNLAPILHPFRDIAFDRSKIAIAYSATPLVFSLTPPTEGFPWDDLRKIFTERSMDGQGTKCSAGKNPGF